MSKNGGKKDGSGKSDRKVKEGQIEERRAESEEGRSSAEPLPPAAEKAARSRSPRQQRQEASPKKLGVR